MPVISRIYRTVGGNTPVPTPAYWTDATVYMNKSPIQTVRIPTGTYMGSHSPYTAPSVSGEVWFSFTPDDTSVYNNVGVYVGSGGNLSGGAVGSINITPGQTYAVNLYRSTSTRVLMEVYTVNADTGVITPYGNTQSLSTRNNDVLVEGSFL